MLAVLLLGFAAATYPFATTTVYTHPTVGTLETPGERVVFVDMVARHGSRYPTSGTLERIKNAYTYVNTANVTFPNPWEGVNEDGTLCERGKAELHGLGRFYRQTFASLFWSSSLKKLKLASTFKQRTQDSLHAFLQGFFENDTKTLQQVNAHKYSFDVHYKNSTTLYFHKACAKFTAYTDDPKTFVEQATFEAQHFPGIAATFKQRSGLPSTFPLGIKQINALYSGARFEYVVFNTSDKMLRFFTREEMETFAYAKDLDTYVKKGYAQPLNYQIAIPLLRSIAAEMSDAILRFTMRKQKVVGNFKFAHEETVLPLMALLGLYKDDFELTASTSPAHIAGRKWNSSKMGPFATHLGFTVVKLNKAFFVRMFINQLPAEMPFCGNLYLCPAERFFRQVSQLTAGFDFERACSVE